MRCPKCNNPKSEVLDTRSFRTFKLRLRRCLKCYYEWKTKEEIITGDEYLENLRNNNYGIQTNLKVNK